MTSIKYINDSEMEVTMELQPHDGWENIESVKITPGRLSENPPSTITPQEDRRALRAESIRIAEREIFPSSEHSRSITFDGGEHQRKNREAQETHRQKATIVSSERKWTAEEIAAANPSQQFVQGFTEYGRWTNGRIAGETVEECRATLQTSKMIVNDLTKIDPTTTFSPSVAPVLTFNLNVDGRLYSIDEAIAIIREHEAAKQA